MLRGAIIVSNNMWIVVSNDMWIIVTNDILVGEQVFKIKTRKMSTGWAQKLIATDTYTYTDCVTYAKVMAHHVRSLMRKGDNRGIPIVDADNGAVPPHGAQVYDAALSIPTFKPHMTKPHAEMPFLRAAALNDAIEHLRNEGHEPVQVATNLNPSPCFDLDHYC